MKSNLKDLRVFLGYSPMQTELSVDQTDELDGALFRLSATSPRVLLNLFASLHRSGLTPIQPVSNRVMAREVDPGRRPQTTGRELSSVR